MEKQGSKKSLFTSPFLEKTYTLLENPELQNIISWNQDGTMILINNLQELSNILPKYFKHRKIQSFIRQLNIYDFKKVKKHIALNAFRHPYFLRNDLSKLHLIKRRVKSGKSDRALPLAPKLESKSSAEITQSVSEKTSEFGNSQERSFEPFETIEKLGAGSSQDGNYEIEDEFDYLCHDLTLPVNNSYYDWEDVFA